MARIAVQIGIILLVGSAIGAADALILRPIQFGRAAPPPIDLPARAAGNATSPGTTPKTGTETPATPAPAAPAPVVPAPATPAPATPAPAAAQPTAPASPAAAPAADFKPTPKDKLPTGHITLDDAKALFDAGASFIDSRRKELYEQSRVPGALRVELSDFSKGDPQALMLVPRDAFVVVYCNGGNCDESEKVAQMLNNSGYTKVYVLHDGLPGWVNMGWSTESGPGLIP